VKQIPLTKKHTVFTVTSSNANSFAPANWPNSSQLHIHQGTKKYRKSNRGMLLFSFHFAQFRYVSGRDPKYTRPGLNKHLKTRLKSCFGPRKTNVEQETHQEMRQRT